MTKERRTALRLLSHYLDCMTYWEEGKEYYADEDEDVNAINAEIDKIMKQIIKRYNLNSI